MKILLSISLIFLVVIIKGQALPSVFPPSPEATSKFNYTDSPVDYYDGTYNVSIPLYEFSLDGKTFPINLFYNTKGVMVAQEASSVGLGWGINLGGVVARQTRMMPDEISTFWSTIPINMFEFNEDVRIAYDAYLAEWGTADFYFTRMDEERDVFTYNFNGYSGKFIIDPVSHEAVMQKIEDIKIDLSQYPLQIKITDPQGFEYYFGKGAQTSIGYYDVMKTYSKCDIISPCEIYSEAQNYKSAWQLVTIKSPTGKFAEYEYDTEYITHFNKSDVKKQSGVNGYELTKMVEEQMTPRRITLYDGTVIKFNKKDSLREDLEGGYALDNFQVLDKNGNQVKRISLSQSYSLSLDSAPNVISLYDSRSKKRLVLDSINFLNSDNSLLNKYQFEYNLPLLPNRHSTSFDYWGYFNGKNNGLNLYDVSSPNKIVDSNYSKAQSLKKIKYPTGGDLEFFYENNLVYIPSFFSSVMIPFFINDDNYFKTVSSGIVKGALFYVPSPSSNIGNYEKEFTISDGQGVISYTAILGDGCTSVENTDCKTTVRLYRLSSPDPTISFSSITQGSSTLNLPDGTYKIVVSNPEFTAEDVSDFEHNAFMITFSWKELKNDIPEAMLVAGGLRVQKTEKTSFTSPKEIRTYKYDKGLLHGIPDYLYIIKRNILGYQIAGQLMSSPPKPVSNYNNGKLGYGIVKEILGDTTENIGYTMYEFTNFLDGGEYYKFPFNMPDDLEWARGLPTITKVFDNNNKLQISVINIYQYYGNKHSPYRYFRNNFGVVQNNFNGSNYTAISDPDSEEPLTLPHYYRSHHFNSIPMYKSGINGRAVRADEIDNPNIYRTAFFLGGSVVSKRRLVTTFGLNNNTEFKYSDTLHHQLTKKTSTLSDSIIIETTYQYAAEKQNQKLIDANMIGIPLEISVIKKKDVNDSGKLISKTETKYDNPLDLLPTSVLSANLQNNNLVSTEVTYDKYDSKGNLQQYTSKDGVSTSFIWGYNQTQLIAKIEGVKLSDITPSLINNIVIASDYTNPSYSESNLIAQLDQFRLELSNYQITTYTYKPIIGVSSITPPSGIREVYNYDTANRLKDIKDVHGNILKKYEYHIKTP